MGNITEERMPVSIKGKNLISILHLRTRIDICSRRDDHFHGGWRGAGSSQIHDARNVAENTISLTSGLLSAA